MGNPEVERETTKIAKLIAKQRHGSAAFWELCLLEAYQEYYKLPATPQGDAAMGLPQEKGP